MTGHRDDWKGWPLLADCLLAAAAMTVQLLAMFHGHQHEHEVDWRVLVEVVSSGSLVLRRRFPVVVFVIVVASVVLHTSFSHTGDVNLFTVLIALYTVSAHVRVEGAVIAGALVLGCILTADSHHADPFDWPGLIWPTTMLTVTTTLGQVQRRSRRRAQRLENALGLLDEAHQRLANEAVVLERNRIAREMHDVVAHGVSLVAVNAGAARMLLPSGHDPVAGLLRVIEKASRESLTEMRHLLGVLRSSDEDTADDRHPQPALQRIPELVERARSSGLELDVVRDGEPLDMPPGQELVAYRIVQEALTNVLKHAGLVRSTATLRYLPDRLVIDVFNELPADRAPASGPGRGGHGLAGMRERVGVYGGTVTARNVDGGFRVTAELPVSGPAG